MIPYKPNPTYEGLHIQANALHQIALSLERQRDYYMAECKELRRQVDGRMDLELESERAANALLTEEVEQLRQQLEARR